MRHNSNTRISIEDEELLDQLQRAAFDYFVQTVNPVNGLVADTSRKNSPVSIAVVGFAMSCRSALFPNLQRSPTVDAQISSRSSNKIALHLIGFQNGLLRFTKSRQNIFNEAQTAAVPVIVARERRNNFFVHRDRHFCCERFNFGER